VLLLISNTCPIWVSVDKRGPVPGSEIEGRRRVVSRTSRAEERCLCRRHLPAHTCLRRHTSTSFDTAGRAYLTTIMSEPTPAPSYIYKILPTAPPTPLPDVFPLSELDRTDGFIHLSVHSQLLRTLSRFFADSEEVSLLKISYSVVKPHIKWEIIKSGEVFPHLYRDLTASDVASYKTLRRPLAESSGSSGSAWEGVLEAASSEGWLE